MNPEAQRIALAKVEGYEDITFSPLMGFHQQKSDDRAKEAGGRWRFAIPDYLGDLNAIHSAAKATCEKRRWTYEVRFIGAEYSSRVFEHGEEIGTAYNPDQCAALSEAILRALNLWTE